MFSEICKKNYEIVFFLYDSVKQEEKEEEKSIFYILNCFNRSKTVFFKYRRQVPDNLNRAG